jgi:hypothetical protein
MRQTKGSGLPREKVKLDLPFPVAECDKLRLFSLAGRSRVTELAAGGNLPANRA